MDDGCRQVDGKETSNSVVWDLFKILGLVVAARYLSEPAPAASKVRSKREGVR